VLVGEVLLDVAVHAVLQDESDEYCAPDVTDTH
jgi:hypothetical protein